MKKSNILIVEDEQIIAENLRFILQEYGYNSVDIAMDEIEAQELFQKTKYHLVLMDINLGENSTMDGIDLIKLLSNQYTFSYIYITANADQKTVQKVKTTNPDGYIVKPFVNTAVFANIEIALNSILKDDSFTFTHKSIKQQVKISEIMYIEAEGVYSTLNISNQDKHLVRKSLSEFMKQYENRFIRIHKSILVNKDYIQGYTNQFVKLNDQKLPLGRSYKKQFLDQIKNLSFS